jgi:hypothetical protein
VKLSGGNTTLLNRLLPGGVLLTLLVNLAVTAFAGRFSRLWADDYCYAAVVQRDGLIQGVHYWYQNGGNRFAAFLAVGVSEFFGQGVVSLLPALLLAGWIGAAYYALKGVVRLAGWRVSRVWLWTAAAGWVFVAVYTSPDRLQTLYWRMGLLHYSLPLVLLLIQGGLLLNAPAGLSGRRLALVTAENGLLALFSAGLSETAAAMQTSLYLLTTGWLLLRGGADRRGWSVISIAGLVASLLAMLIMALSPANAWRQALLPPPPTPMVLVQFVVRYTLDFVLDTLRTLPLPLAVWLGLCAAMGWLLPANRQNQPQAVWIAGLLLAAGLLATAAAIAPSAYAGLQYPAGRALMTARFPLLSGLGLAAAAAAIWLKGQLSSSAQRWLSVSALIILLLVGAYVLRATQLPLSEAQVLAVKAARWDARQAEILSQRAAGSQIIRVREVDVVSTLEDLTPQPEHWVNSCAADYYQVEQIIAER